MTVAQCQADAADLRVAMLDHGVPCSIELMAGRGTDPWLSARKYLRMHHHTVSRWCLTCALTPVLGLCKVGRPGIPGPLCNGYGGYDGIYRIICMGLANHPGEGGPVTIDGVHVPANSAREPTWGTEWEGGLQDWPDIRIPRYPGGMLEFMGRADNALVDWTGRPLTSQLEHSTWTSRKIDRRNINRATGIALTQQYSGPTTPPKKEILMLRWLLKGNAEDRWFLSDLSWKREIVGDQFGDRQGRSNSLVMEIVKHGGKVVYEAGNPAGPQPVVWDQTEVDRIRDVNDVAATEAPSPPS